MAHLQSPYGWSDRYAAAQARKAEQESNAAKNGLRQLHIRKVSLEREFASISDPTPSQRDEHEMLILEIEEEMAAMAKALEVEADDADAPEAASDEAKVKVVASETKQVKAARAKAVHAQRKRAEAHAPDDKPDAPVMED